MASKDKKCKCGNTIWSLSRMCRSCSKIGRGNPMFGRKHSKTTKMKMGEKQSGSNNSKWKGDKVEYQALHQWIRKHFGSPTVCEDCGASNLKGRKIHWANKSGKYLRVRSDWKRICVKCHHAFSKKPHTIHHGNSRIRSLNRSWNEWCIRAISR